MERTERLENERLGKLILSFSLPSIIGMVVLASYNIVDRIFVGHGVGALAITGITVTYPIILVFMAFGMMVGVGSAAQVSLKLGEKKKEEAEKIAGNSIGLSLILSVFLMVVVGIWREPLLMWLGGTGQALEYAIEFMDISIWGIPFQTIGFGLNNVIRGEGNPKVAMTTMLISSLINIGLNPLFIFGFNMGIKGSALATVISQFITMVWVLLYFYTDKSVLKLKWEHLKIDVKVVYTIISIGISPFAMHIGASCINMIFNNSLLYYGGDMAIAAMGIANSVLMFIAMPIFGINQGIQPIIGYNFGAKLYMRVKKVLTLAVFASTVICVVGWVLIMIFGKHIVSVFTTDETLLAVSLDGMRKLGLVFPIVGFQVISASYFQAVGKAKNALFLSTTRQILFILPAIFILPLFFQLDGVWFTGPFADSLAAVVSFIMISREMKKLSL